MVSGLSRKKWRAVLASQPASAMGGTSGVDVRVKRDSARMHERYVRSE
jgi:hypothetical protein